MRPPVRFAKVRGDSMSPTLSDGDLLVCAGVAPRRGDLVVLGSQAAGRVLVKRVVAVGPAEVRIADGDVLVDGHHDDPAGDLVVTAPDGGWAVGPDEVFVLADRRSAVGGDSRTFGPVPRSELGVVVAGLVDRRPFGRPPGWDTPD